MFRPNENNGVNGEADDYFAYLEGQFNSERWVNSSVSWDWEITFPNAVVVRPNVSVGSAEFAQRSGAEFIDFELTGDNLEDGRRVPVGIYQSTDEQFDAALDTQVNLGLSDPFQSGTATGGFSIEHARPEDGDYFLVVANPDRGFVEETYADNVFVLRRPDIAVESLEWDTANGGLKLGYEIVGSELAKDAVFELYWATNDEPIEALPTIVMDQLERSVGKHSLTIPVGFYSPGVRHSTSGGDDQYRAPAEATQLLLVADPQRDGADVAGAILEFDEENNKAALALPRPITNVERRTVTILGSYFDPDRRTVRYEVTSEEVPAGSQFEIEKSVANSDEWIDVDTDEVQLSTLGTATIATVISTPRVAGNLRVRGVVEILGIEFASDSEFAEETVQFPDPSQLSGVDGDGNPVISQGAQFLQPRMRGLFERTLRHTAKTGLWAELGFWIQVQTRVGANSFRFRGFAAPAQSPESDTANSADPGDTPFDDPANRSPIVALRNGGGVYTVGLFHTHLPNTTYKRDINGKVELNASGQPTEIPLPRTTHRDVGPTTDDIAFVGNRGVAGFVYDYVGKVYVGLDENQHTKGDPLNSPARIYSFGPRRVTP